MPERYEEEIEHILEDSKDLPEAPVDLRLDQLSLGEEIHAFYQSVKISRKYSALVALVCLSLACFGLFFLLKAQFLWVLGLAFVAAGYVYLFLIPQDILSSIKTEEISEGKVESLSENSSTEEFVLEQIKNK